MDLPSRYAALLTLAETGLGSLLHAFHVPFTGHFLSLNQGFLLSRASLLSGDRSVGASVSSVAALLKSLSPAGKKLTPMLAIAAQGMCFCAGTLVFGTNPIGILVGMVLLSLWAFVQPVLIYLLFYGDTLLRVGEYYLKKIDAGLGISPDQLMDVVIGLAILKAGLALAVGFAALRAGEGALQRFEDRMIHLGKTARPRKKRSPASSNAIRLAIHDVLNPWFLLSLALTALFLFQAEGPGVSTLWALFRPVAAAFLIFLIIRVMPLETLAKRLGGGRLAQRVEAALRSLKE